MGDEAKKQGVRLTLLAFLMKASVAALRQLPGVQRVAAPDGENLILKQYYHIGVAVDTPNGLVVPVIRDVGQERPARARARARRSQRAHARAARSRRLICRAAASRSRAWAASAARFFTPIINAPEVAILGVGKAAMKPVWNGKEFAPRLMLPLSLSYDHRVIDGALGARFISYLAGVLADIRKLGAVKAEE